MILFLNYAISLTFRSWRIQVGRTSGSLCLTYNFHFGENVNFILIMFSKLCSKEAKGAYK